jgi:hypothetical protein
VLAAFNSDLWPTQIVAYLLGVLVIWLAARGESGSSRWACGIMGLLHLLIGVGLCAIYWAPVYLLAWLFAALNVAQGAILLGAGAWRGRLQFSFASGPRRWIGLALMALGLVGYPLMGPLTGRTWPAAMLFGMVPCPTSVFELGLLHWAKAPVSALFWAVPLFAGLSAWVPVSSGVTEDLILLTAGLVWCWTLWQGRRVAVGSRD